jgi:multiple sugar transport system permease protein
MATALSPSMVAAAARERARRPLHYRVIEGVGEHALAVALSLVFVLPLAVVLLTSLMTQQQAGTGQLWPDPVHWGNFREVFQVMPFARDLWNTVLYAGLSAFGIVLSSIPVAYAVSRMRWRGRNAFFVIVLATMMIPAQVTSLPLYVMYAHLGWIGTLKPLIVPAFFGDAFSIFLLRQFFLTLPEETIEAARVDGASEYRILRQVVVPMARPALAAIGLFAFMFAWNDFYNPLLYSGNSTNGQTLAVGLAGLAKSAHQSAYQLQMAASLMFLLPVLLLFLSAQKVFIEGIAMSGNKG